MPHSVEVVQLSEQPNNHCMCSDLWCLVDWLVFVVRFGEFTLMIVRDMILANCVWRAGRTAAVIRKAAVACLWALVKTQLLTKHQVC